MSDWICPSCGGGFPDAADTIDKYGRPTGAACPWCGEEINAE